MSIPFLAFSLFDITIALSYVEGFISSSLNCLLIDPPTEINLLLSISISPFCASQWLDFYD